MSSFDGGGCVFIYYDPKSPETRPEFKYPNNNIDICYNINTSTFERVIITITGISTATTNIVLIPSKNGSNYSQKQIYGLMAMNNVDRLLSIKRYDPNFIIGRETTDLSITLTDAELIQKKINSTKYNKEQTLSRQQFKNLVLQKKLNLNLNLPITNGITCPEPSNINKSYTPFKLFRTGRTIRI